MRFLNSPKQIAKPIRWDQLFWIAGLAIIFWIRASSPLYAQGESNPISGKLVVHMPNGQPEVLYENSYALVIGAGKYEHWPRLNFVESETRDVAAALRNHGFQVEYVPHPNGKTLKARFEKFINDYGYNEKNRLLIFFAGHGHTRKKTKGYLVPVDAPDPQLVTSSQFLKYALSMDQIIAWAKIMEAQHVLFVFDSCFSGTVFQTRALHQPQDINKNTIKPTRQFITAGTEDEKVPAKSHFTPYFIRALEGDPDANTFKDSYLTGSELGKYLTSRGYENQTPVYGKILDPDLNRGDFVFALPGSGGNRSSPQSPDLDAKIADLQKKLKLKKELKIKQLENQLRQLESLPEKINRKAPTTTPRESTATIEVWHHTDSDETPERWNQKGDEYNFGIGVSKNHSEAIKWYRKAANQGHAESQFSLGIKYNNGEGVHQNYAEAVKWVRKAAFHGLAGAQDLLGFYYERGMGGLTANINDAVAWYRRAADQGDENAKKALKRLGR